MLRINDLDLEGNLFFCTNRYAELKVALDGHIAPFLFLVSNAGGGLLFLKFGGWMQDKFAPFCNMGS